MRKDFTQPFTTSAAHAYLLLEDGVSGKFIIFGDPEDIEEYGEESAYQTLMLDLQQSETIAFQLARFLSSEGFVLNEFQELTRITRVSYSFVDNTLGSEVSTIVLHAIVNIVDLQHFKEQHGQLIPFKDYSSLLNSSLFGDKILRKTLRLFYLEKL